MPGHRPTDPRVSRIGRIHQPSRSHEELIASAYDLLAPRIAQPVGVARDPASSPGPLVEVVEEPFKAIGA